jgi:hypothetical protein
MLLSTMWGIGDNIHLRAVVRELLRTEDVWLETSNPVIFRDLIDPARFVSGARPPRIREGTASGVRRRLAPYDVDRRRAAYNANTIAARGSVLAAQFASCNVAMPDVPDFRIDVPDEWRERLRRTLPLDSRRPILVYRPVILNKIWHCPLRSPLPEVYDVLFRSISSQFFTVGVADLSSTEWIAGPEPQLDLKLHRGELDFQLMAALFAEAHASFTCPGFAPILSQAVGTPTIIVYGGYECFETTHRHGAALTPTLPIETTKPCSCFSNTCGRACAKQIAVPQAIDRIRKFIDEET